MRWAALIVFFLLRVAGLPVCGSAKVHRRRADMAGFNAFRKTYRPVEALTIMEFYNRIYYYFKELLVTILLFFPAYLRYFKKRPKVRLFMGDAGGARDWGTGCFTSCARPGVIFRHGFWNALADVSIVRGFTH
jgi:hypothetical protein